MKSLFALSLVLLVAVELNAQTPNKLDQDPFVVLYRSRLDVRKVNLDAARTEQGVDKAVYIRNQQLRREGDISEIELRRSRVKSEKSELRVKQRELEVNEYELVFEVVKLLRSVGREVPLFP